MLLVFLTMGSATSGGISLINDPQTLENAFLVFIYTGGLHVKEVMPLSVEDFVQGDLSLASRLLF